MRSLKRLSAILAIALLFQALSSAFYPERAARAAVPANNTVANGSFEAGSGGSASGWSLAGSHARASDRSHEGTYGLKSTGTSTAVSSIAVNVVPQTTYRISVWIYKENNDGTAYVDMNDIGGEAQIGTGVGLGGGQWSYSETVWNSGSLTAIQFRAVTDASPTGAIWFDDIRMVPVSTGSVLGNGSFEDGTGASATGWTLHGQHQRSADRSYEGSYSLKSTATTTSASSITTTVQPNVTYLLSGRIYKDNGNGIAYIDMNDISQETEIGVDNGQGAGVWTYVEGLWNSGSNTSVTLRAVVDGTPTGAIWFDDIRLVPQLTGNDRVSNGSFEIGSGASASAWTQHSQHERSDDRAHDGNYSLKSTATATAASSTAAAVEPNTTYKVSAWIYKETSAGTAYVDMNDRSGEVQIGVGVGLGAGVWTYAEAYWQSGSSTSITVRAVTDGSPTGAIWFDEIRIAPIQAAAGLPENGSFEFGDTAAADAWTQASGHARSDDRTHDGNYALKASSTGTAVSTQDIDVDPNTDYVLSAWIYKSSASDVGYLDLGDIAGEPQFGSDAGVGGGRMAACAASVELGLPYVRHPAAGQRHLERRPGGLV
ncbi:carbohydrate binding domain-containing protein [Cohnella rhizosphaerae]|uniref:Carbohydrate binding domain-containing protein n=1 Tax=Cohnella rhizosphaerae TaxID=1457232 RepID=A0A9X4KRY7_9BACL|nr:carbohydrate binding domain-containing protein [Cohnella rhizosphaerae]MDG0810036.1 carbohydrate binding domain-containing protein [Cohnella rhizosphaerae]